MQHNGFPEAQIYETEQIKFKNPIIFAGFVGAGLSGTLSVSHIINELGLKEIGFMLSLIHI